jgi:hypothetical protein
MAVLRTTPAKAATPNMAIGATNSAPLTLASGDAANKATGTLRLSGVAKAPSLIEAQTANVKNGFVVGSPLKVIEAATGRVIKQGVTYYDGSFQIDVPTAGVTTPAVVSVELVDAKDSTKTFELEAPVVLDKGLTQVTGMQLTTGSTGMVMLYRLWAQDAKGSVDTMEFAKLISSTTADTTRSFGLLVAQDPTIPGAKDVASLQTALVAYVERTSRDKRKYNVKRKN